jgi:Uma2 family endonuclease
MSPPDATTEDLPAVDDRLAPPETRYEVEDGRLVYVPPALEPHGFRHAKLAVVLDTHRAPHMRVAVDMLTRLTKIDDIAPDVSVYPAERDPATGGRQIEQLAFEIASTQTLAHVGRRAAKMVARGVRRVFAIHVEKDCVLEWSGVRSTWSMLDRDGVIADPALAIPVPVLALLDEIAADEAVTRAVLARGNRP